MSAPAIAATRKLVAFISEDVVEVVADEARMLTRSGARLAELGQLSAEVGEMIDHLQDAADLLAEVRRIVNKRFMELVEADAAGLDRLAAAVISPMAPCEDAGCCALVEP